MRKTRKRVFAAVLAAALLFTMPGMASYAEAEDAQTKDISESVTVQAEDDAAEETEAETEVMQESEAEDSDTNQPETGEDDTEDTETDSQEPAEEIVPPAQKEDAKECTCGILCTQDSINGDCPVCGAEDADLSRCKGEKTENSSEENKEDAGLEDAGEQDDSANLCAHHKEHTKDCGYSRASEDGEGSLCTYECRICPIEGLIAALPQTVTEANAETVRWQLDEILALYTELTEDEQGQLDLSPCWDLQAALDAANAPVTVDEPTEGDVARVEMPDGTTTYVSALAAAFVAGNSGAKITLLADVDIGETTLNVPRDTNFTLDCGNFTLSGGDDVGTLQVDSGGALTFVGGTVRGTGSGYTVHVNGTFTMSGGVLDSTSSYALLVDKNNNVHVTVTDGTVGVSGIGLYVNENSKATIALSGGTYSSIYPGREGSYSNGFINRPVSSVLAPGYALKGADGKFIPRDATKTQSNVKVVECTHDGAATPDEDGATHGGDCPYCGTEFEAAPHKLGEGNVCEGCGTELKVQVEIGNDTTYYGDIDTAWTAAKGSTATVTLLDHVTASGILTVDNGGTVTFDGGNYTLTSEQKTAIEVNGTLKLVSGTVLCCSDGLNGIYVRGTLEMTGGAVTMSDSDMFCAVQTTLNSDITISGGKISGYYGINLGGTATIKNGEIYGGHYALSVNGGTATIEGGTFTASDSYGLRLQDGRVILHGGTFTGRRNAVKVNNSSNVSALLDTLNQPSTYYAYFLGGQPVNLNTLADAKSLPGGTYAVQECKHEGVKATPNSNGTHSLKCPYCGYNGTAESCDYSGSEYTHNENGHWLTCQNCGYQNKEAHTLNLAAKANGTVITVSDACDCGYQKDLGTVTLTVPTNLIYHDGQTIAWTASEGLSPSFKWDASGDGFTDQPISAAGLDAREHTLNIEVSHDSQTASSSIPVTVKPATLTEAMVEPLASVTYSGAAQEPAVTVKQGDTTLGKGTDYDVTYSTTDFTNAGTITVTITGKGNYTGEVKTAYTIKKAPLTITASSQTITYGGSITQGAGNVSAAGLCSGDSLDRITLTTSTANVPGGNITPSAAGIKNSGGKDVTGNYEITYKDGSLTINKADAEITVGTGTYSKTFGDAAFALDVTDNNTEADVQYEVTAGADVISISNGTVTIKNAGTATITVSLPETANYNAAASKTITVNVARKGGYTVAEQNRSYLYSRENTGSIDLAALLPKDCGTVTYGTPVTSGNVTYSAAPAVNDGILSYTLNSGKINDEGTITVTVSTRNYTDITITVKVKLTDQMPVRLKDGTEVTLTNNVLTYGEPLSKLVFNKAEFVDDDGKPVEGTLAWKDAAATPNAGTTGATWVFTPTDEAYAPVEGTAAITVNKAVPAVSAAPTVADRVYDPSAVLQDSELKGGTVNVPGSWSWQKVGIIPVVNNTGYEAIFTPENTTNYETVTRTVTVNVTKATPYIAYLPQAAQITYGDTLKDSGLSGGTVQYSSSDNTAVAGSFAWKDGTIKPASGSAEYTVVFTPNDSANYSSVETEVELTIKKAQNAPNMPGSTMSVSNSIEKVGSVQLPAGWEWQASDKDTALEVGVAVSAVAVYTGADKGNYENETVTVAITRSNCDHVAGDVLYTGEGEKAPTCTEDGLGHRECTVCGAVMESGIVVEALKHTGGTATCSKRAVCTRCNQPYGDTNSNIHGGTEVRGFVAATCTAGGYTGDIYCKDCGAKTGAGNATSALGHDYTGRVTEEPTTEREGERTYTCTRCGDSYKESIPKLPEETHGHSYTDRVTKEPTCTDTGVRTYTCTCGDSYTETIAALGHHYLGSETKKPTTTAEGVMIYTCDRCGHSYTRPIAKLPGDDTTKPGSSQPGDTEPGSGNTEETRPEPGIPFIKGEDGKIGWEVIRAEEEQAKEGSVINVDMNGTTVVPGDIFDCIRGRDITITFDMGGGIIWSVEGKSVTADKTGDIDFSVKTGVNAIPVDIVNNVTGESYSIQISLAHEGEFGFTAVLSINLGKENAGNTASLFYYNQGTGELEFICADDVAEDGMVSLAFTHASDYVIAIDGDEEESGGVTEDAQPQEADGNGTEVPESPKTMQEKKNALWPIVAGIIALAGIAFAAVFAWKKKEENESAKEEK